MSWTNRDLLFWSKSHCFASKNHRWGLRPIETSNSGATHAVLKAQNGRWGLVLTETSISGGNHAVLHAQNDRWGLVPIETCNSGPKVAVLHAKTTDEGWDTYRQVILVLSTLFYMHKMTSYLGPIKTCYSGREVALLHAKTTDGVLDPQRRVLKSLFCMHKTTGEGCKQYCLFSLVLSALLYVLKTTNEVWNP